MWAAYNRALASHPLRTKIGSSVMLAVSSDVLAQGCDPTQVRWDKRRTAGLAAFGFGYMAIFQHYLFAGESANHPAIDRNEHCCTVPSSDLLATHARARCDL